MKMHRCVAVLLVGAGLAAACGDDGSGDENPPVVTEGGVEDGPPVGVDAADVLDATTDSAGEAAPDADADADAAVDAVVQVASGRRRTCFLYTSGHVKCVGENLSSDDGQNPPGGPPTPSYTPKLGDGLAKHLPSPCPGTQDVDCSLVPVTVAGLSDAVEVGAGETVTCARRLAGTVVCWGQNEHGQIGDGTLIGRPLPTAVAGLVDAVQITVGKRAVCARRATGGVVCWGQNEYGSLGNGTVDDSSSPVVVSGLTDAIDVSLSEWGGCAVRSGGSVVCWGIGKDGNLGDGVANHEVCGPYDCSKTPVAVVGVTGATVVSRSTFHACIRRGDGTMACWGDGVAGNLGDGLSTGSSVPVDVLNMTNATGIRTAMASTCARRATGQVACWGSGGFIDLGLPAGSGIRTTPDDIPSLTDATRLSSGFSGADGNQCALRPLGRVSCWGRNSYGELGNGTVLPTYEPTDVVWK